MPKKDDAAVQARLDRIAEQFEKMHQTEDGEVQNTASTKTDRCVTPKKRGRMAEEVEDKLMLKRAEADTSGKTSAKLIHQPPNLKNGTLRDYQLEGVRWLIHLYQNNINGILADEMGLGKTVQAIGMIAYLAEEEKGNKSCVIAPKSVLSNWMKEFAKWLPSLRILMIGGSKEERASQVKDVRAGNFDVVVTSFEVVSIEKAALKKISWRYMVIDEAHRIKNENSLLSQVVREFDTHSRLLLTGTPLQNNLHELWALLNFLLPEHFGEAEEFDQLFQSSDSAQHVTQRLQRILRPFLLRRLKSDVEAGLPAKTQVNLTVPLSLMQRRLYASVLKRDVDAINGKGGDKSRLLNIVMQLRKVCNHPYLFEGQEPGPPFLEGEHLIDNCSKLKILDGLLRKAKEEGARVLVFSQMTRMLDILEDYCLFRSHAYCRIDGGVSAEEREVQIEDFMSEGSDKLLFLLSTRAGGLGLNLQKANWVVLYDSDWNPQADIQAMDRCHRIGQTKPVTVFRFVTEHSVEERMVERAMKKLFLDAMVVQQGRLSDKHLSADKEQLLEMIRFGADTVMRISNVDAALDLERILSVGKIETEQLTKRLMAMAATSMSETFRSDGGNYCKPQADSGSGGEGKEGGRVASEFVLEIGRRERREVQYNEEEVQREQGRKGREMEEEEREERRRQREEEREKGWTPDPKKKKTLDPSSSSCAKGGKAGPADMLLRRLIEAERKKIAAPADAAAASGENDDVDAENGAGDDCESFQFRAGDCRFTGRYDSDYMIVGEYMGGEDSDSDDGAVTRFASLSAWAFACKGRAVSVKPVVFYRNKSLRQYETEAVAEAIKAVREKGEAWGGPTDPQGVVAWREGLMEAVRGKLSVGEDEVERIVRQELESWLLRVCSNAVKEHAKAVADARRSSRVGVGAGGGVGGAGGAGAVVGEEEETADADTDGQKSAQTATATTATTTTPSPTPTIPTTPVPDELLAQVAQTLALSALYKDEAAALKSILRRAGTPDAFLELLFARAPAAPPKGKKAKGGEGEDAESVAAAAARATAMAAEAERQRLADLAAQLPTYAAAAAACADAAAASHKAAKESKRKRANGKTGLSPKVSHGLLLLGQAASSFGGASPGSGGGSPGSGGGQERGPATAPAEASPELMVSDRVVECGAHALESGEGRTEKNVGSAVKKEKRKSGGGGKKEQGREAPSKKIKVEKGKEMEKLVDDEGGEDLPLADRASKPTDKPAGRAKGGGVKAENGANRNDSHTRVADTGKLSGKRQNGEAEQAPTEREVDEATRRAEEEEEQKPHGASREEVEKDSESETKDGVVCETAHAVTEDEIVQRLVGKVTIRKLFSPYGYFAGLISSYDAEEKLYTVHYVDDDEEEFTFEELRPYVLQTAHAHLLQGPGMVGGDRNVGGGGRSVKKARAAGAGGSEASAHEEIRLFLRDLKFSSKHWPLIRKEIARDDLHDVSKAKKWIKKIELNLPFKMVQPEFALARPSFVDSLDDSLSHLELIALVKLLRSNIKPEFLRA